MRGYDDTTVSNGLLISAEQVQLLQGYLHEQVDLLYLI